MVLKNIILVALTPSHKASNLRVSSGWCGREARLIALSGKVHAAGVKKLVWEGPDSDFWELGGTPDCQPAMGTSVIKPRPGFCPQPDRAQRWVSGYAGLPRTRQW